MLATPSSEVPAMSIDVTNACRKLRMPSTRKCVLMAICDHADKDGRCWPSITTLSEFTCFSRSSVLDAVEWLERERYIRIDRKDGLSNRITVDLGFIATAPKWPERRSHHTATATGSENELVAHAVRFGDETGSPGGTVRHEPEVATSSPGGTPPVVLAVRGSSPGGTEPSLTTREPKRSARTTRTQRPKTTPLPEPFVVSEKVRAWAEAKGFTDTLDAHVEHFVGYVKAKGTQYANWDQALVNSIRDDWGKVRERSKLSGQAAPGAVRGSTGRLAL